MRTTEAGSHWTQNILSFHIFDRRPSVYPRQLLKSFGSISSLVTRMTRLCDAWKLPNFFQSWKYITCNNTTKDFNRVTEKAKECKQKRSKAPWSHPPIKIQSKSILENNQELANWTDFTSAHIIGKIALIGYIKNITWIWIGWYRISWVKHFGARLTHVNSERLTY